MLAKEIYDFTVSCGAPRASQYVSKEEVMEKRFGKAKEESEKKINSPEEVISFTKEFLQKMGFENPSGIKIENPSKFLEKRKRIDCYNELKEQYNLNSNKHIVWMKFTLDGYLGVVAGSDDINFDMINTTSGKIISYLDKTWDETLLLIFPLPFIGDKERSDIECGIGNYLINKKVAILDYYSHQYK